MLADRASLSSLEDLGFTPLEAVVYREVLRHPDCSGYAIAKAIGRPEGNTYNVLAALTERGAVAASETRPRTFRATPPRDLLQRLRREFEARCAAAEDVLGELEAPAPEGSIYRLTSLDQLYDRARGMIAAAERTIVYEAFPAPFAALSGELAQAAGRLGQGAVGLVLQQAEGLEAAHARLSRRAADVRSAFTAQSLTLITDAAQVLLAVLSGDGRRLLRATYFDDLFLGYLTHSGIVSDIILHTSDLIEQIGSPNRFLLGQLPPSLEAVVREG